MIRSIRQLTGRTIASQPIGAADWRVAERCSAGPASRIAAEPGHHGSGCPVRRTNRPVTRITMLTQPTPLHVFEIRVFGTGKPILGAGIINGLVASDRGPRVRADLSRTHRGLSYSLQQTKHIDQFNFCNLGYSNRLLESFAEQVQLHRKIA
jgi:hypothetical protein